MNGRTIRQMALACLLFSLTASAQELPPAILADQYLVEAKRHYENGEYQKSCESFAKVVRLGVKVPVEFYFFYGRALDKCGDHVRALEMLTKYLLGAGQRGEYYQKALELRSLVEEPVKRWEEAKRNAPRIKDSIAMVGVPAGCFMMGGEYEKPVHRVCLAGFEIQKTEATAAQYMACVAIGACTEPDSDSERKCNWKRAGRENHPISCVDWDQGRTFCTSIGGRLPTEAEWEYAARGTDGRKYPWGNQEVDGNRANFCDVNCKYDWRERAANDGYRETAPVGSFPRGASPFGALDMAGNVSEWVADWHDDTYYQRSPEDNPRGPVSGSKRVERGGGWYGGRFPFSSIEPHAITTL